MSAKIKIERGEAVRTAPVVARIGVAKLREMLKIPEDATVSIVGETAVMPMGDGDEFVAEWTETKAVRPRKREAAQ